MLILCSWECCTSLQTVLGVVGGSAYLLFDDEELDDGDKYEALADRR